MKKIKILIISMLVIIVIIVISLIFVNKGNSETYPPIIPEEERNEIIKNSLQKETQKGNYLLIDDLANNYFLGIAQKDQNKNNADAVYEILDEEFIKVQNITKENVLDKLKEYSEFDNYSTKEIYVGEIEQSEGILNTYIYVKGILRNKGNIQEVYLIIRKDDVNFTFSIEPISKETYNSYIENGINIEKMKTFEIEENEYNKLYIKTATDYEMCLKHMQDYKNAVNNDIEEAYNLLDKDYKTKRFGSIEKFEEYRVNKQETYGKENFTQYLVQDNGIYTQYICKDMYGNLYIFEETVPMEYTLKLDTYTIPTEEFKKEYETQDVQKKVQMNLNKFILMINNQDWENAYNLLDNEFKNNQFKTMEEFKKYIEMNSYRYNEMKVTHFDVIGNIYKCSVELTDATDGKYKDLSKGTGESGYIYNWTFMVQLGEEYEFKISFNNE